MKDKIIQISTLVIMPALNQKAHEYLFALTEQGNIYKLDLNKKTKDTDKWDKIFLPSECDI